MKDSIFFPFILTVSLFTNAILIAHVIDLDYISPQDRYEMDKGAFERARDNACQDYISYDQWKALDDERADRFGEWLADGIVASFDWNYEDPNNRNVCGYDREMGVLGRD